jgi:hypothetical protein
MKERKLNIFTLLSKIDSSKDDIYLTLSDEEKKEFFPLVVMRWMTGTNDERQIMMLNEFVNPYIYSLSKHPHLLMKLLQICSSKTKKKYNWIGLKKEVSNKLYLKVVTEYYDITEREVLILNPPISKEKVLSHAESLGWDKPEMAALKKELG